MVLFKKFEEFHHRIQVHFSQTEAAYLFACPFQKTYLKDRTACYINFLNDVHSESEVLIDTKVLYGALLSACHVGVAKATLEKYSRTQDGIRVWIVIIKKYSVSVNKNMRIMQLENVIAPPFHRQYRGRLIKWVQDYENTFVELATLGKKAWSDDNAKKCRLINNAQNLDITSSVLTRLIEYDSFVGL